MLTATVEQIKCSPTKSGACAKFAKLSDDWGLKYWRKHRHEEKAKDSYRMNKFAAKHGLAPQTGEWFEFSIGNDDFCGYFVEVITETIAEREERSWWDIGSEYGEYDDSISYNSCNFDAMELPDLVQQLLSIGFKKVNDLHAHNVGYTKNGNFVCIDFDCCILPEEIE